MLSYSQFVMKQLPKVQLYMNMGRKEKMSNKSVSFIKQFWLVGRIYTFAGTFKLMCNVNPVGIVPHFFWDAQPPASIIIFNRRFHHHGDN